MKSSVWLLLSLISVAAVPLAGQEQTGRSAERERALGRALANEFRKQGRPLDHPVVLEYVNGIAGRLLAARPAADIEYRFEVMVGLGRTEPVSFPGGTVFIPAECLLEVRDSAEFAALLAHSMGHIELGHGLARGPVRETAAANAGGQLALPVLFMGGWQGAHADSNGRDPGVLPIAVREKHRGYELEADGFAVRLAARAGYRADALRGYVARVQPGGEMTPPLPERAVRLARLDEAVRAAGGQEVLAAEADAKRLDEVRQVIRESRAAR